MRPSPPGNANLPLGALQKAGPEPVWHSRGYLPHLESSALTQHVTFRLADSLPQEVLRRLQAEVKLLAAKNQDAELRKRLEGWIDAGHGSCVLRTPEIAAIGPAFAAMFRCAALPAAGLGGHAESCARTVSAFGRVERREDCGIVEKIYRQENLRPPAECP